MLAEIVGKCRVGRTLDNARILYVFNAADRFFGLSWTPCVGTILGGVLTYVASQGRSLAEGTLLLGTFSLGIVLPLLIVAIVTDVFLPRLRAFSRYGLV
ncbi:MAG TPA: cytochrome c biogenesis protein CcdA [Oligoflexus sp.]|uniref:cytochrome c biogenesis CcdA family protein n=1 Tax=Oligoflexus sp. TaxID=1971216 RepID=UPI002D7F06F6|nr:cytochrome c biogenesis protein CcdA [Oligoflexus sp.]HET9239068.1 cytochrome c biogenesis protein CcdA [Oligoflexus sp.]